MKNPKDTVVEIFLSAVGKQFSPELFMSLGRELQGVVNDLGLPENIRVS